LVNAICPVRRDRLAALDDRSEAARWLGDPPP
jgi:hypothetical protein